MIRKKRQCMKTRPWTSGFTFSLFVTIAHATATTLNYHGAIEQTFTVPSTGMYQIIAYGAQGGSSTVGASQTPGGKGGEIGGNFLLTGGEVIDIYVGGAGGSTGFNGGGGGGTFVVGPANTPLVVAGGGGGAVPGKPGQVGQATAASSNGGAGGGDTGGGGGGGFTGNGSDGILSDNAGGHGGLGFPILTGGAGDSFLVDGAGGFGAGGGAGAGGGGGGGGYSGGNGGGSFDSGTGQILIGGEKSGNGEAIISLIPNATPEPATFGLFSMSLVGLSFVAFHNRTKSL